MKELTSRELMCVYIGFTQGDSMNKNTKAVSYALVSTAKLLKLPAKEIEILISQIRNGMVVINEQLGTMVEKARMTRKDPFNSENDDERGMDKWR